jgi:protein-disulfide isomerase
MITKRSACFPAVLAALVAAGTAYPGDPPKPKPRSAAPAASREAVTRQQADAILNELREMRLLLEKLTKLQEEQAAAAAQKAPGAPAAAPSVSVKIAPGTPILGDPKAPVTMVEYIDLQCSFCRRFGDTTFAEIRKNLIDTGKVRFVSRDFPLDMHPDAMKAAVATHCAAEQGGPAQFWRMREMLLSKSAGLTRDALPGYAQTAGLDPGAFGTCLDGTKYNDAIKAAMREGMSVGVQGTPSFLIGRTTPDGVTGSLVVGALPYEMFEAEIKKAAAQ